VHLGRIVFLDAEKDIGDFSLDGIEILQAKIVGGNLPGSCFYFGGRRAGGKFRHGKGFLGEGTVSHPLVVDTQCIHQDALGVDVDLLLQLFRKVTVLV